jgi:nucleoside-diphosphate-sugar epimerase
MARYLITGIAGFIGSTIAQELLRRGQEVKGVDNLSTGKLQNIQPYLNDLEFHHMDINETDRLRELCRGVDYVLHQAALASVPRSVGDPKERHIANIDGTLSVLLAARDAGVSRVVYAASSSAYGDQPTQPKNERMLPKPLSPYAVQKLAGEQYVKAFSHVYGLQGVCLRYFNVFGPRQSADSPYSGVIARFSSDMLGGRVPTIFGDGTQSRDFTFVDNVVSANMLACAAPAKDVDGNTYNVGNGRSTSLCELYAELARLLNFKYPPHFGEPRVGDVTHSEAELSSAMRDLNYLPIATFEKGLAATVDWYIEQTPAVVKTHRSRRAYADQSLSSAHSISL